MTKAKQAIKEANSMADKAILKAKLEGFKSNAKDWLNTKVYGYKRGVILLSFIVMVAAVLSAS